MQWIAWILALNWAAPASRTRQDCPIASETGLTFRFYGNQDMFDLHELDGAGHLAARYTMATCWAPATPTLLMSRRGFLRRSSRRIFVVARVHFGACAMRASLRSKFNMENEP